MGVDHDLLNDIAGIHATRQGRIQSKTHQFTDGIPVPLQKPIHRVRITALDFKE